MAALTGNSEGKATTVSASSPAVDLIPMDEHRHFLIQIVMLLRVDMRTLFGMEESNRWGFFVDMHLSRKVHEFARWLEYPKGNRVLKSTEGEVWAAAVSNDGYLLFTGSDYGKIFERDMLGQKVIQEWKAHSRPVSYLAFQSGLLASGSSDTSIRIWDTWRDYRLVHTLEGHTSVITSVDFNDQNTQLVSGSDDYSVRIWSLKTGDCVKVLTLDSEVSSVLFVGSRILCGLWERLMKVWSTDDWNEIHSVGEEIHYHTDHLSINCDRSLVACPFGYGFSIYTWPEMKFTRKFREAAIRSAFHPSNPSVLAVSDFNNHSIQLYNVSDGQLIRNLKGHSDYVRHLCFTPDGSRLLSVSEDKSVIVWDLSEL